MSEKTSKSRKGQIGPPVWEWIFGAVGLLLVVGTISAMLYRSYGRETMPPSFEISIDSVSPVANGYLIEFSLRNTGTQTAANLVVEGTLEKGGEKVETSSATLAYAPANSERHAGLYFTNDPGAFELVVRPVGYEKP